MDQEIGCQVIGEQVIGHRATRAQVIDDKVSETWLKVLGYIQEQKINSRILNYDGLAGIIRTTSQTMRSYEENHATIFMKDKFMTMEAPSYFLSRPPYDLTPSKIEAFECLWTGIGMGRLIDYQLPYPKWEFLSYLCESKELVLHGSQVINIDVVEPRQANDKRAFSSRKAIYATTDGIWVIYFAILDRKKYPEMSLFNSCFQARLTSEQLSDPLYFFSITQACLIEKPWCEGTIYILPRDTFYQETQQQIMGAEIFFPHWISSSPSKPVAKIEVRSHDFPFLERIHGHNNEKLVELYAANPGVFPIDALES